MIYADTSFLASAYVPDVHSNQVLTYLGQNKPRLPFAFLHWPELAKVVFSLAGNPEETWSQIDSDLLAGVRFYRSNEDCERIARRAAGLMRHHVAQWPKLRSLDVLHVSTAVELGAKKFLSFDGAQRLLAKTQKLEIWPDKL